MPIRSLPSASERNVTITGHPVDVCDVVHRHQIARNLIAEVPKRGHGGLGSPDEWSATRHAGAKLTLKTQVYLADALLLVELGPGQGHPRPVSSVHGRSTVGIFHHDGHVRVVKAGDVHGNVPDGVGILVADEERHGVDVAVLAVADLDVQDARERAELELEVFFIGRSIIAA